MAEPANPTVTTGLATPTGSLPRKREPLLAERAADTTNGGSRFRGNDSVLEGKRRGPSLPDLATYAILIAGAVVMLLPFAWMVSTSLKTAGATFVTPPNWLP